MRKLILLFLASTCWATTTVTGHVSTLGTTAVTSSTFVRFWLRGCGGNAPRINGTSVIAPSQGGSYFFDFPVNSSGNISGSLYSTRDGAGTGNGEIECGGSQTSVWYGMQVFNSGKGGPETPIHAKSGGSLDVSNVTSITTSPVVNAPSGDTIYARIDGGNTPFSGAIQAPKINSIVFVGSTYLTCDAAVAALGGSIGTVYIPSTYAGSNCSLPLAANVTLIDLRGGATQIPSRSDTFVNGDYITYNSTIEGALAGFAVQHGRTSPSLTSSAILGTSKFTGTLPNAQTLAAITGEADLVGAITPGTGTLISLEAYTAVRSTGGTLLDARGVTSSVQLDLASSTTNVTNASGYVAAQNGNISSTAAIANSYGFWAQQQIKGTARNYGGYFVQGAGGTNFGAMLLGYNSGTAIDAEDSGGIPHRMLFGDTSDRVNLQAINVSGLFLKDSTGTTQQKITSTGTTFSTGIGADGGGLKHKRGTAGCATAASVGGACTTTVTWTTAFADANYTATCTGDLITSGVPVNGGLTAKVAASVTFQTVATTAAAAQYTNIDCTAVHD